MGSAEVRIAAVSTLIYASAAIPQDVIEVRYQLGAGWVYLKPYSPDFVLAEPVDGIDPIWNPGIFFRHLKSALNTEAPHLLQNDKVVALPCLRHAAV